jgi:hypothetical protein
LGFVGPCPLATPFVAAYPFVKDIADAGRDLKWETLMLKAKVDIKQSARTYVWSK